MIYPERLTLGMSSVHEAMMASSHVQWLFVSRQAIRSRHKLRMLIAITPLPSSHFAIKPFLLSTRVWTVFTSRQPAVCLSVRRRCHYCSDRCRSA